MLFVDPHVHLRDFRQKNKETVMHGLEVARDSGLAAVLDMPNTDPPIMDEEAAKARLSLADNARVPEVFYGTYMGLTADPEQVKRAADVVRREDRVVGMKLYAGHSVGELGVIGVDKQRKVYAALAEEGYDGVLAVHCEKEEEMDGDHWDPTNPVSHCFARPEKAEIESVRDQLRLAEEAEFGGKLHIAHISSPEAVDLVVAARERGMDVSSGICPHHFIYDWTQMYDEKGVLWKMNPPLRGIESKKRIFKQLKDGKIDWVETDHAPHTLDQKIKHPFMSGLPGIPWWPMVQKYLERADFSDTQIEALTGRNVVERFGLDIDLDKKRKFEDRRKDYAFDPYGPMAKELRWPK